MTRIAVAQAPVYLRGHMIFKAGSLLSTEKFFRLSSDPRSLSGLSEDQKIELLNARRLNRSHYLPYCTECELTVTTAGMGSSIFVHENEEMADHVAVMAQHEGSYEAPAKGLSYVVYLREDVAAWVLNDGTVTLIEATSNKKHREMIAQALEA